LAVSSSPTAPPPSGGKLFCADTLVFIIAIAIVYTVEPHISFPPVEKILLLVMDRDRDI
jgi:hypothetical protein